MSKKKRDEAMTPGIYLFVDRHGCVSGIGEVNEKGDPSWNTSHLHDLLKQVKGKPPKEAQAILRGGAF